MKSLIRSAAICAAPLVVFVNSSQAGLVLGPTTVSWPGTSGPDLSVTYFVDLEGSTYYYDYVITAPADYAIDSFTVDFSQQATLANVTSLAPVGTFSGATILPGQSVTWDFNRLTGTATNSFTSMYSPMVFGLGDAQMSGVTGSWTAPTPDLPVPVPEAPTIFAAFSTLLPLGYAACRAVRKSTPKLS